MKWGYYSGHLSVCLYTFQCKVMLFHPQSAHILTQAKREVAKCVCQSQKLLVHCRSLVSFFTNPRWVQQWLCLVLLCGRVTVHSRVCAQPIHLVWQCGKSLHCVSDVCNRVSFFIIPLGEALGVLQYSDYYLYCPYNTVCTVNQMQLNGTAFW